MRAALRQSLHPIGRISLYGLVALLASIMVFLVVATIGGYIPRNSSWRASAPDAEGAVPIMVQSNGIHTELVMPIVTAHKDWREDFPTSALPPAQSEQPYTHIAIGWGEREVFLETPAIEDVSPLTVLRAITIGGDGLLHVTYFQNPATGRDRRVIYISAQDYARLVGEIERSMAQTGAARAYPGYGSRDVFYDAPGRYHIGNSCNQWVSDRLAGAGITAGAWTPLPAAVLYWAGDEAGKKE